jgi:hypothetical protein
MAQRQLRVVYGGRIGHTFLLGFTQLAFAWRVRLRNATSTRRCRIRL